MRMFLPIKGPGGRYLTPREKVALLILGVTLILCALTLLAGDGAYASDGTRNPVSAFVAFLCRTFGGGIIALYALVLVWSGLIYFKGERVVDMRPLAGRLFATLCVTLGISGVLGIAHLETAGSLGLTVGAAIGNTFGATLGFPILIVFMLLGVHLAGQGAWSAMREPVRATATTSAPGGLGFGLKDAPQGRFAHPPLPDDGDPTADERTLAITKAMEEIERSKGVTIVDVQPAEEEEEEETDDRPSIGEEVDEVADIDDETEEADVRRGVAAVEQALAGGTATEHVADDEDVDEDIDEDTDEVEQVEDEAAATDATEVDYGSDRHGFVPVPPEVPAASTDPEDDVVAEDDECIEAVFVGDLDEEDDETDEEDASAYEDASDADEEEYEDDDDEEALADEVDDVETYDDEEEDEDEEAGDDETAFDAEYEDEEAEADEEYAEDEAEDEDDEEYEDEVGEADDEAEFDDDDDADSDLDEEEEDEDEESDREWVQAEFDDEPAEAPVAAAESEGESDDEESYESVVAGQADGAGEEDDEDDPYAQGGLLRRLKHGAAAGEGRDDEDRPYTAFDWRGRPLE